MSLRDDLDLRSNDPLIRWEALRRRSEPTPKPAPKPRQLTDAEASRQWTAYIDQRVKAYVHRTVEIVGEEVGLAERRLREQTAELRAKAKETHNALFDRVVALERQFDRYVEANNKQKVTIIAPQLDIAEAVQKAIAPLQRELEIMRTERRTGGVIDLPNPLAKRRA